MPLKSKDVTTAELAIMRFLWQNQFSTALQLANVIYREKTASSMATVQTLLKRLEGKGYIERNRMFWPHLFSAKIDLDELIRRRVECISNELCKGSRTALLSYLLKNAKLNNADRKLIRKILDH